MAKEAKKAAAKPKGKKAAKPEAGKNAAKKKPAKAAKPAPKAKSARGKGKKGSGNQLTWLAWGILGLTLTWFVIGGYFATSDLMARRAACIDWLVAENRGEEGYKRVFNTEASRFGCSLQKLGLRGFMAEPPIYPNARGLLLVFGPPLGFMAFYLLAWKFRRGWILRQKKKVWAKAGPLNLDDFEDMRDLPSEEEIREQEEAEAREKLSAADSMDATLEDVAGQQAAPAPKQKPAKPAAQQQKTGSEDAAKAPAKPAKPAKPAEAEKPEEELSELEKILRQVDD